MLITTNSFSRLFIKRYLLKYKFEMADQFLQGLKQSFSLADIDQSMDFTNPFPSGSNPCPQEINPGFLGFPHDSIFPQLSEFPGLFIQEDGNCNMASSFPAPIVSSENDRDDRKRKSKVIATPESSTSAYSSPQCSASGIRKTNRPGRGKKVKVCESEDEQPKEVIHVRARRGQATDSHSLAERVRRGKINERLRCLQDIVPGCYKYMGMAVMLDETINYVQSLQSQVEFLSMRLTAASTFHDFNSDVDAMETIQRKAFEALKVQNAANQGLNSAQLGLNFGCYPQLPHSR